MVLEDQDIVANVEHVAALLVAAGNRDSLHARAEVMQVDGELKGAVTSRNGAG